MTSTFSLTQWLLVTVIPTIIGGCFALIFWGIKWGFNKTCEEINLLSTSVNLILNEFSNHTGKCKGNHEQLEKRMENINGWIEKVEKRAEDNKDNIIRLKYQEQEVQSARKTKRFKG